MSHDAQSEQPKVTTTTALSTMENIFRGMNDDNYAEYQQIIEQVPFDQSEFGMDRFGVDVHMTEWRMLRQLLLNYDGKAYDIRRAEMNRDRVHRILQSIELDITRLEKFRGKIKSCKTVDGFASIRDFKVRWREGDSEREQTISCADTASCYDDVDSVLSDLNQQIDTAVYLLNHHSEDQVLGLQQTEKLVNEAKQQADHWGLKIQELLPKVLALKEQGIGFNEQEAEYWTLRFKRNIEMGLLATSGVDAGILDSIASLPKPYQEEITQFANRVRSERHSGQGFLPVEFKTQLHAAARTLPELATPDQKRLLAEHSRKVRVVVAMPRRLETDTYVSDLDNYLVPPAGAEFKRYECWNMPIDRARNHCIEQVLAVPDQEGADWILFVDDDVLLPRNALMKLLETAYGTLDNLNPNMQIKEPIVGGYYTKKIQPLQSANVTYVSDDGGMIAIAAEPPKDYPDAVIPINGILASGCLLIHRSVLTRLGHGDWFRERRDAVTGDMLSTDDYHFTQKSIECGFSPKLHCGVRCIHFDRQRNIAYGDRQANIEYCTDKSCKSVMKQGPGAPGRKIMICVPRRSEADPIETNFEKMLSSKRASWAFWNPIGMGVAEARNKAVETAIGNDCDYLLFIDNDVIVPQDTMDRLLEMNVDFVAGQYTMKTSDHRSAHILLEGNEAVHAPMSSELARVRGIHVSDKGLIMCNRSAAMGITMLSVNMLRDIQRTITPEDWETLIKEGCAPTEIGKWFVGFPNKDPGKDPRDGWGEDSYLTNAAIQCGYSVWIAPDVHAVHVERRGDRVKYYGSDRYVNQETFTLKPEAYDFLAVNDPRPSNIPVVIGKQTLVTK